MYNLIDLANKRLVLVGASKGIGRTTAILLSQLGAQLVLIARNESGLQDTMAGLDGTGHVYRQLDITELAAIEVAAKEIVASVGPIDGIIYCAGITDDRPLALLKPDSFDKVMQVNLNGFIELVRCFTKKCRFNPGMRIVAVSSIASKIGRKAHLAYSVSKAGINSAVQCMAKELADKKIAVNAVIPGMIQSEMYTEYLNVNGGVDSNINRALLSRQYLGIGESVDIANAIAFLISPAASFITGVCLPVDGGFLSN